MSGIFIELIHCYCKKKLFYFNLFVHERNFQKCPLLFANYAHLLFLDHEVFLLKLDWLVKTSSFQTTNNLKVVISYVKKIHHSELLSSTHLQR